MTRFGSLLVAVALASSLACGAAHAQAPAPDAAPAAAAPGAESVVPTDCPTVAAGAERRREAARLFGEGERASTALQVGTAAHAFACSYTLVATAQAAYNAAVAYEGIDQAVQARHWFQRYLERSPDADDRAEVAQRVTALDVRIAEAEARAQAAREEEARRAEAAAQADAAERAAALRAERARGAAMARDTEPRELGVLGLTGIIAGGAGVAAGITGVVLYVLAGGVHDDFVAGGRTDLSLVSDGETLDLAASSLWIAGGALVLAGVGLTLFALLGPRTERAPSTARLAPYLAPRAGAGAELGVAGFF